MVLEGLGWRPQWPPDHRRFPSAALGHPRPRLVLRLTVTSVPLLLPMLSPGWAAFASAKASGVRASLTAKSDQQKLLASVTLVCYVLVL